MKVVSVNYKKIFPIQQFVNETIGIEVQVDDKDNVEDVLDYAKSVVESWHEQSNKVNGASTSVVAMDEAGQYATTKDLISWSKTPPPSEINIADERKVISIENASSIEELATLKKDLPTHLMKPYMEKLTALTAKIK